METVTIINGVMIQIADKYWGGKERNMKVTDKFT